MGLTIATYAYVGFRVQESDFWDVVPAQVATCDKGHELKDEGPFCSLDGTRFERRSGRTASAKFKALAEHFNWTGEGPGLYSYLSGYERIYANIQRDGSDRKASVGLYAVNQRAPALDDARPIGVLAGVLAIAKVVARIEAWDQGSQDVLAWDISGLLQEFTILENARKAAGFTTPVQLFFSLYVS